MPELVTVVVPTYNRADLIVDALDSVRAQTHRPIELLIVDDGSTDGTEEVVQDWQCRHESKDFTLSYIRQDNQGGNPARNNGIRNASGKYIAFLDSDDTWLPYKLEKQLPKLSDADVGAVYCGVQHMNFQTHHIIEPSSRRYPEGELLQQLLVRDVTVQTSAYVVRRDAFEKVGDFDTSLLARQDWDMWIRVAAAYKIACVPEVLVNFREHTGVRTASNPLKEIDGYQMIRKKYAPLLAQASLPCRLQARSSYFKRMGRVYFKHRISIPKAISYSLGAIACWPFDFDAYAALGGMLLPRKIRQSLHRIWNRALGKTAFAIRSH